jgi:hypothetical protein
MSVGRLQEQVCEQELYHFDCVVCLGGEEYRYRVAMAFGKWGTTIRIPFAGLAVGKAMQATNKAVASNLPL